MTSLLPLVAGALSCLPSAAGGFGCNTGWSDDYCPAGGSYLSGCARGGYPLLPEQPDWLNLRARLVQDMFGQPLLPNSTSPSKVSTFSAVHRFPDCLYSVWGDGDKSACEKEVNVTELVWEMDARINETFSHKLQSKVFITLNTSGYAPNYWTDHLENPDFPVLPRKGNTLVVFHNGHGTSKGCPTYGDTDGVADWLNQLGFDVAMVMMPFHDCNRDPQGPFDHEWFKPFADAGLPWVKFFVEPAINTINYATEVLGYERIVMMGLSGGGWTTTVTAALDPRIMLSMPVAGSMPCDFRHTSWDFEQFCDQSWARIGNYTALYVLAALEPGRTSVQMIHEADPCCFHGCGRHRRIEEYNAYVRAHSQGQFRTAVTEGNLHQVNLREKAIAATLIAKIQRGKEISASDVDSPFSILSEGLDAETFII
eukprot:gb/GFBE01075398.1/.p1 GENE.gb/GFBE01075398.1/~~gb/GFBE01075398.1/.p1  ORF type:complete len:425 (+),score=78.23 gb/GFBE01075398.1/:2-1276(+)